MGGAALMERKTTDRTETEKVLSEKHIAAMAALIPPQINAHDLHGVILAYYSGTLRKHDNSMRKRPFVRSSSENNLMELVEHEDVKAVLDILARRCACPAQGEEPFQGWWYLCLDHSLERVDMDFTLGKEIRNGKEVEVSIPFMKDYPTSPVPQVEDHATAWALCAQLMHMRLMSQYKK